MRQRIYSFCAMLPLLGLSACWYDAPMSDGPNTLSASSMATLKDAIYLTSPSAGAILRLVPGPQGDQAYTDLEGTQVDTIFVGPGIGPVTPTADGRYLLLLNHDRQQDYLAILDPDAPCTGDYPVDASCIATLEAKPLHDRLELSPDGRFAISYISEQSASESEEAIINLNEVGIYDLEQMTVTFVPLGYNPKAFAFTQDPDQTPRAVVLTASQVTAVNLETPTEWVTRALTLSTDTEVSPSNVILTGDDRYALVTIKGSADLFTFDLSEESLPINILSLSGDALEMARSADGEQTLVLTNNGDYLNIIHHQDFSVDVLSLEDRMRNILVPDGADYAVLYNNNESSDFLYVVDPADGRLQGYLLDNPYREVQASPGGDALAIFYVPRYSGDSGLDGSYAVALLNLAEGNRQPNPIMVSSYPLNSTFARGSSPEAAQSLFVSLNAGDGGIVGRFNLSTFDTTSVDTPPGPETLAILPSDNRVVVLHSAATGLISIFPEDAPEKIQLISGFMAQDMFRAE